MRVCVSLACACVCLGLACAFACAKMCVQGRLACKYIDPACMCVDAWHVYVGMCVCVGMKGVAHINVSHIKNLL